MQLIKFVEKMQSAKPHSEAREGKSYTYCLQVKFIVHDIQLFV